MILMIKREKQETGNLSCSYTYQIYHEMVITKNYKLNSHKFL